MYRNSNISIANKKPQTKLMGQQNNKEIYFILLFIFIARFIHFYLTI